VTKARTVTAKKRCCKDKPRCKRCPVVCKRLEQAGHAEKVGARTFVVIAPKKAVKAARARA
jgi:hypothetical protein